MPTDFSDTRAVIDKLPAKPANRKKDRFSPLLPRSGGETAAAAPEPDEEEEEEDRERG